MPETSKEREGFYYPRQMNGTTTNASITLILRDFEKDVCRFCV